MLDELKKVYPLYTATMVYGLFLAAFCLVAPVPIYFTVQVKLLPFVLLCLACAASASILIGKIIDEYQRRSYVVDHTIKVVGNVLWLDETRDPSKNYFSYIHSPRLLSIETLTRRSLAKMDLYAKTKRGVPNRVKEPIIISLREKGSVGYWQQGNYHLAMSTGSYNKIMLSVMDLEPMLSITMHELAHYFMWRDFPRKFSSVEQHKMFKAVGLK